MTEVTRDYERPIMVVTRPGFQSCWRDSSKQLVEPATPEQQAYLGVPPGTWLCLDCSLLVPEDFQLTEEMRAEIDRRGAVIDWEGDEEKLIPLDKDRQKSFNKQTQRWDSEEYGCWK